MLPLFVASVILISIHAPTRGATVFASIGGSVKSFQSTLPREERRCGAASVCLDCDFNPRSHERSDLVR